MPFFCLVLTKGDGALNGCHLRGNTPRVWSRVGYFVVNDTVDESNTIVSPQSAAYSLPSVTLPQKIFTTSRLVVIAVVFVSRIMKGRPTTGPCNSLAKILIPCTKLFWRSSYWSAYQRKIVLSRFFLFFLFYLYFLNFFFTMFPSRVPLLKNFGCCGHLSRRLPRLIKC